MEALDVHRLQFAFTATYHYLFPQLTMGLALLILGLKTAALRRDDERLHRAARFWTKIFGVAFAAGVVTGIPLEFQFGTNWSAFSRSVGAVIGQTLAMEGVFAFFLESSLLALFLLGEEKMSPRAHWTVALLMFLGTWLSGFLIVATNAWMQHPVGHEVLADGSVGLVSLWDLLTNRWALWQYAHTMAGAVVTGGVTMASVGAWYLLAGRDRAYGRLFVRWGVTAGLVAALLQPFPLGDAQGRLVAEHQPPTLAAMEGLFRSEAGAPLVILGQPDMEARKLDNRLEVPRALSFLTYRRWDAEVRGLEAFPTSEWPDHVPLLYYAYHIMVGLGTLFVALLGIAAWKLWRGSLYRSRPVLWLLLLLLPFPFIANTAGWTTAELGRQPWIVYGLMRTSEGASMHVSGGNATFTLLGFMGLYAVVALLVLFLVGREIAHGPGPETPAADGEA